MLLVEYIHYIVYMIMYIHVYIRTFFDKLRLSVYGKHSFDTECLCFIKITLKHPIENNFSFPLVSIYCAYHLFVYVQSSSFPFNSLDGRKINEKYVLTIIKLTNFH